MKAIVLVTVLLVAAHAAPFDDSDLDVDPDSFDKPDREQQLPRPEVLPAHLLRLSFEERTKEFILRGKKRFEHKQQKDQVWTQSQPTPHQERLFEAHHPSAAAELMRERRDADVADVHKPSFLDAAAERARELRAQVERSELAQNVRNYFADDKAMASKMDETHNRSMAALDQLRNEYDEQQAKFAERYRSLSDQLGEQLRSWRAQASTQADGLMARVAALKDEADRKWRQLTTATDADITATPTEGSASGVLSTIYKKFG